jgi:hypothetical protein
MSQVDTTKDAGQAPALIPDALELATLLRPAWGTISTELRRAGVPLNEGDDGGDGAGDGGGEDGDGAGGTGADDGADDAAQTFPAEVVRKLRSENAAARKRAQEAEARAKEFEDRDKTEQQKLAERAEAAEKAAQDSTAKLLRYEVAAEKNVPANLAKFLTGSTKEELEKAADELLKELGGARRQTFDGGARDSGQQQHGSMDDAIRRAAGRT